MGGAANNNFEEKFRQAISVCTNKIITIERLLHSLFSSLVRLLIILTDPPSGDVISRREFE